jgi:signal transduction histidine kinase
MTMVSFFPWSIVVLLAAFCCWQHRRHRQALKAHAQATDRALRAEREQSASKPQPIANVRVAPVPESVQPGADAATRSAPAPTTEHDQTPGNRVTKEREHTVRLESFALLAGGAGHDFANHLASILGHLSLAQLTDGLPAQVGVHLAEVERSSKHARDLTEQLLAFARCETPDKQLVELPFVIGDSIAFALHDAPGVVAEFVVPDNLWTVEADSGQLVHVFNNLVVNAVHAMAERSGVLRIVAVNLAGGGQTIHPLGDRPAVHIRVVDTGPGIPPEKLPRVFDPFFVTNKNGTALGLATVNYAIRKHGGHIEVESTLGVGTTFHVYLPAQPGTGSTAASADNAVKQNRKSAEQVG